MTEERARTPHSCNYDVFLSFRGEDTRFNFTDHLYQALKRNCIETFMDKKLPRGKEISSELLTAIESSKTSLVLLSENYASSRWCLDELVHILECKEKYGQRVIPVFYKVEPSEVRKQTGKYGLALAEYERDNIGKVQKWREALTEVSNLSGFAYKDGNLESSILKKICKEMLQAKFNRPCLIVAKHLVGIDYRVEALESLLQTKSNDVRIIGIWGMGGIGKTTIAKAVYKNMADHFDASIFLENVKEESRTKEGIIQLQKGLISKVLGDGFHLGSVPEGTKKIEDALRSKKVLLVLDDVDKGKEIENLLGGCDWFAAGSRIIITTRDNQVLNTLENPHYFKVEEMDQHEALELFSKHAFHRNQPDAAYLQLAKQYISYAHGLPLVLEIMGSSLRGKSISKWQSELDNYERITNKVIQDLLNVNFEGLDKTSSGLDALKSLSCLFVAKYPVGIDCRAEALESLLQTKSNDVRIIGIWGMGGIGKTTIAKAVYNNMAVHFDASIFLENVREESRTKEGIIQLQKGLLSKVLGDGFHLGSVPEGTKKIEDALRSKKVLLVLDDVDKGKEIENLLGGCDWFAVGSRIIITTRDKQVLNTLENPHYFKVEEMDQHEALELFSKHAFHKNEPDAAYLQLSKQIISYTNGLPLALEIIGYSLRGKSISVWQSDLDKYERIINKGIQDVLKVSYEGLDKIEQDVFLDIACFFWGFDKDYVVNMLEACGQFPNSVIPKFIDRCLITVDQFGKLSMHDLVRDMGRGIVQEESPYNAGQRSRLWHHTDALEVLIGNTGTVNIRGLKLCSPEPTTVQLEAEVFKNMKNLKFLIVRNVKILGGLEYLPNGLRLLDWPDYTFPLPATFCPQLLVELNMPYSHIKLEEPFKQEIQFKNMEYIRCESCETIMKFPAMCTPNLKELNLSECKELVEVHESVRNLDKLELLILKGCEQLQILPRSLMLRSLRYFDLRDCSRLEKFPDIPDILPGMESLQILLLSRTGVKGLPSSIGNLIGLEKLDLSYCQNLMDLPDSIYKLRHLRVFEICGCTRLKIDRRLMSNSFSSLPGYGFLKLKYLNLSNCENLTELDFLMMPDYFPELEYLYLDGTNIGMIPESINKFARLRRIGIENCMRLQEIPRLPQAIRIVRAMNCPLLNSWSLSSLLSQAGEILGILPKGIFQGARSNILIDPQSSNRLSHQFVPSPLVFEDFASETEGSRSEDEDIDSEIILRGVDIPKWFKYRSVGHSIPFCVGPKFPELAVCIAFGPEAHRGGFVCEVYLSINGCKKRINFLNCKKEVCDHLWLFSKSHRELQKQMNDSNPSNWNNAKVVCNLYFPDGGESIPAFIKGCGVHVDCACHPQNSDFFNDNYENVIDN